jgi:hypothetical protein
MSRSKKAAKKKTTKVSSMKLEALEPRLLLTADPNDPFVANTWTLNDPTLKGDRYTVEENRLATPTNTVPYLNHYLMHVDFENATGIAGTGWDVVNVSGRLDLNPESPIGSTDQLNREQRYTLRIGGIKNLVDPTQYNEILNFNRDASYRWKIIHTTQGFTGTFDPKYFNIDTVNFIGGDVNNRLRDVNGPFSLLKGKFELEQFGTDIYLNYIGGVTPPQALGKNTLNGTDELTWEINDFNSNNPTSSNNPAPVPVNLFDGSETELFGHDVFTVDGALNIATNNTNPVQVRVRTLASSKNAITLAGAGHTGSLHNFDFNKPKTWDVINTTGGVTNFAPDKFKIVNESEFFGFDPAKYTKSHGTLKFALTGDGKRIVLIYEPPNLASDEIHFRLKTGDVALLDLKAPEIFGPGADLLDFK